MSSDFVESLLSSDPEYTELSTICENVSWSNFTSPSDSSSVSVTVSTQTADAPVGKICPECHQLFVSLKGMRQHMAKTHVELERTASCPVCRKMFRHKYAVNFHIKQVHNKTTRVTCLYCDKEIYNKYMLKKHVRNYHLVG